MTKSRWIWWTLGCVLYLACCVVLDLFPRFGPPDFRYTGSDPAFHVWNLGWPLALAIYDARSGLHIGPFPAFVPVLQFFLLAIVAGIVFLLRNQRSDE